MRLDLLHRSALIITAAMGQYLLHTLDGHPGFEAVPGMGHHLLVYLLLFALTPCLEHFLQPCWSCMYYTLYGCSIQAVLSASWTFVWYIECVKVLINNMDRCKLHEVC